MNLASHITHWPENATHAVVFDGEIAFTKGGAPVWDGEEWSILDGAEDSVYWLGNSGKIMSSEWCTKDNIVTRAQWEAERVRIAGLGALDKEHTGEAITSVLCSAPGYEQELWDKVAVSALAKSIGTYPDDSTSEQVRYCFEYADAFMAERSKRLKK